MKVPTDWLQDFLSQNISVKDMAEALELAGVEVEQIIYPKTLDKKIVVAQVTKVVQHPNADRLKLATVKVGRQTVNVVCGAPNVRDGLVAVLALPGAVLPGGQKIEKTAIRGQESNGMLCSPSELGLSDDHSGLLELDQELPIGKSFCDIVRLSTILDVKTPANRSDLQSIVGLAREIAAIKNGEVVWPEMETVREGGEELKVELADATKVPRYVVEKLAVGRSQNQTPGWMQTRLVAAGVRPINLIVDVTNYVMLEYGQPLHAFDAKHVSLPLSVRLAIKHEKLTTLDGQERQLSEHDLVIADKHGPIGLAGVLGGASSQITPDTKEIILESATFDAATIRKTALRHGLRSEASARFERGLPVQLAPLALARAVKLLEELAEAKTVSQTTDRLQVWPWVQRIGVRRSQVSSLLGMDLRTPDIVASLARLGIQARPFDIAAEARSHLGKPYVWGAKFRTHGTTAFDCSYLIDYLYSLIGQSVGHTAAQIVDYGLGRGGQVQEDQLVAGDVIYRDGVWEKLDAKERNHIAHVYLYIGNGRVIHAKYNDRDADGKLIKIQEPQVVEEPVEVALKDPQHLGAVRLVDNLDDYVTIEVVPWWRPDLKSEADVAEEVARMVGYQALPTTLPSWRPLSINFDQTTSKVGQAKSVLKALGLFEVMTYSFVSAEQIAAVGYKDDKQHLKLRNPLSVEQAYLRRDLLASLLTAIERNQHYSEDFGLFEMSRLFLPGPDHSKLPDEPTSLAAAVRGGYQTVKQALDALAREFNCQPELKAVTNSMVFPGRAAQIYFGGQWAGWLGQLHPDLVGRFDIKGPVSYLELKWDEFLVAAQPKRYHEVSRFPAVIRDLSLLIKDKVTWAEVETAVAATNLAWTQFVSEYRGPELPAGHRSLTMRLKMSANDRTLTDQDAADRIDKILVSLKKQLGATLR